LARPFRRWSHLFFDVKNPMKVSDFGRDSTPDRLPWSAWSACRPCGNRWEGCDERTLRRAFCSREQKCFGGRGDASTHSGSRSAVAGRQYWTLKGNKAHGRRGRGPLATVVRVTDSSAEQSPEAQRLVVGTHSAVKTRKTRPTIRRRRGTCRVCGGFGLWAPSLQASEHALDDWLSSLR
jgi:hypothetical protein